MPFNSNSPTGSTLTASSTATSTRGLMRICPAWPHRKAERRRSNRSDSGIVKTAPEADGAERGKAMRNPNAKANVVPQPTPFFCQGSDGVT